MIEELKQKIEKIDRALFIAKIELNSYYPIVLDMELNSYYTVVLDVKPYIKKNIATMEKNAQLRTERINLNKQLQELLTENNGSTQTNS